MNPQALNEVGAGRSIVIDETGTVLAGNATIEAAAQAGLERVQVVDADGRTLIAVRRSGLTPEQKVRLALYDNRTAELADWDDGVLAELVAECPEVAKDLWSDAELNSLLADASRIGDDEPQLDRAAELQEQWGTALGQLWALGDQAPAALRRLDEPGVLRAPLRQGAVQPAGHRSALRRLLCRQECVPERRRPRQPHPGAHCQRSPGSRRHGPALDRGVHFGARNGGTRCLLLRHRPAGR